MNSTIDFIKKIATLNTSEDIDAIDDPDIRAEVQEEDLAHIRDALDRIVEEARAIVASGSDNYIDFSGEAIREHYFEHNKEEDLEGLTDQDLQDAGEWALNSGSLWDSVYAAWDYGVKSVRAEKQTMVDSSITLEKE